MAHRRFGHVRKSIVGGDQQTPNMRQQGGSDIGERDAMGGSVEQRQIEQRFDLSDRCTERGLGNGHPLGRAAEIGTVRQLGEESQLPQGNRLQACCEVGAGWSAVGAHAG
ncbi:hypothetical protein ACVWYO_004538 [Sphingomonas sp. UYP23]